MQVALIQTFGQVLLLPQKTECSFRFLYLYIASLKTEKLNVVYFRFFVVKDCKTQNSGLQS